jgi:hypothetical protein
LRDERAHSPPCRRNPQRHHQPRDGEKRGRGVTEHQPSLIVLLVLVVLLFVVCVAVCLGPSCCQTLRCIASQGPITASPRLLTDRHRRAYNRSDDALPA